MLHVVKAVRVFRIQPSDQRMNRPMLARVSPQLTKRANTRNRGEKYNHVEM